ncbi:hypothetical protein LA080_001875 [Diaporthe eres]|nr:hypothetical protein LA080_001875 [Diaporthe eres]
MSIVKTEEIYTINAAWLTAFFVAAIAMLAASTEYVDLAPGFGTLGGLEMTKAFEKIEFRYGVVSKSDSGQEVLGISWKVSAERVKKRVPYV